MFQIVPSLSYIPRGNNKLYNAKFRKVDQKYLLRRLASVFNLETLGMSHSVKFLRPLRSLHLKIK